MCSRQGTLQTVATYCRNLETRFSAAPAATSTRKTHLGDYKFEDGTLSVVIGHDGGRRSIPASSDDAIHSAELLPRHKAIPGNEAAFGRFGPLPFDVLVLGAINVYYS